MRPQHSAIVVHPASDHDDSSGDAVETRTDANRAALAATHHDVENTARSLDTIRQRFAELTGRIEDAVSASAAGNSDARTNRDRDLSSPTVMFGPRERENAPSRRTLLMNYLTQNRILDPLDPNTSTGRRVEAMAAVRSAATPPSDANVERVLNASSSNLSRLDRQREQLIVSARTFRRISPSARDRSPATNPQSLPPVGNLIAEADAVAQRWGTSLPLWRENLREHRPVRVGAPFTNGSRSTTSFSWANTALSLPPGPPRSGRPPAAPIPSTDSGSRQRRTFSLSEDHDNGSMPILADLDSDQDDDPYSWLMDDTREPQAPIGGLDRRRSANHTGSEEAHYNQFLRSMYDTTALPVPVNEAPSSSNTNTRRRRGWARLDQDGNEIPTDEEEEFERVRTLVRAGRQPVSAQNFTGSSYDLDPYEDGESTPPSPYLPFGLSGQSDPLLRNVDDYRQPAPASLESARQTRPPTVSLSQALRPRHRYRHRAASPLHDYSAATPFRANPLPWAPVDLNPPSRTRAKERRGSTRDRISGRSPIAGR